jgi:nicotinamide-nucleotide amidase
MKIELVTIGTELLLGFTVDTNGAEIARALASIGVRVVRRTSVPDEAEAIRSGVAEALGRTGAVLTTGGLGPTRDDISKKVVAELFGMPIVFDDGLWSALLERYTRLGRTPAASNRSQAEVPAGGTVLPNRWGSAPGLWLESERGLAIMLPGVPLEMRNLLAHEVVPRLAARGGGTVVRSRVVRVTGIPESSLAERLGEIERDISPLSLAYLPGNDGVDLRLTAWGMDAAAADAALAAAATRLRAGAGEFVYGEGDQDLAALVLGRLRGAGFRLAVAESCTGGLLGGRLTEVPGSSDVFLGGVISYHDDVKRELLEVSAELIAAHGAVSEPVVRAMAEGAARRLGADVAVAVTGIAGPGGGSEEKPVGTVWFATWLRGAIEARRIVFPGTREEIRARAVQSALYQLSLRLSPMPV